MPTIQKLQQNLTQSQQWGTAFREQIKKLMEEITTKNEQIAKTCRSNIDTRQLIRKAEGEVKGLLEEKQRNGYKRDKVVIKVDELKARIAVYQEGLGKKVDWNKELKNKLTALEKAYQEQQNITAIQEIFDTVSESKVSVSSLNSHSSEAKSQKSKSSVHPMIDSNLSRLKKLEENYCELAGRCRQKQEDAERERRREGKLREALRRLVGQGEGADQKENIQRQANPVEEVSKQTRMQLRRVKELEEKESRLKEQLQQQRDWINKYTKHLETLTLCDAETEPIRTKTATALREARKERKTVQTICGYILREIAS